MCDSTPKRRSTHGIPALPDGATHAECTVCARVLPRTLEFFYRASKGDGLRRNCRKCCNEYTRSNHAIPHKRERHHDRMRANSYGVTALEFVLMEAAQAGLCAICRKPEVRLGRDGKPRKLSVDHNHRTGEVRGLLCGACNAGLGLFRDCRDNMRYALVYLESYDALEAGREVPTE